MPAKPEMVTKLIRKTRAMTGSARAMRRASLRGALCAAGASAARGVIVSRMKRKTPAVAARPKPAAAKSGIWNPVGPRSGRASRPPRAGPTMKPMEKAEPMSPMRPARSWGGVMSAR